MSKEWRKSNEGLETCSEKSLPETPQSGLEVEQAMPEVYYQAPLPGQKRDVQYYTKEITTEPDTRKICGLRRTTFFLVLALIILLVIVAAVGGGVGGVLASKHDHSQQKQNSMFSANAAPESSALPTTLSLSSITATPTGSVKTISTPAPTVAPKSNCKDSPEFYKSEDSGLTYQRFCNSALVNGVERQNLMASYEGTFDGCVALCDSYNYYLQAKNMTVAYWDYSGSEDQGMGMCFCMQAADYTIASVKGTDVACLLGSFDDSDVP